MEDEEIVQCSVCGEEPDTDDEDELESNGWDLYGEFGLICPDCSDSYYPISSERQGIDGLGKKLGLSKDEEE